MVPSKFEYACPETLNEALSILDTYKDDAKLLAGGQSLISAMKLRLLNPEYLIDLGHIAELDYIREEGDQILIGSRTTQADVKSSQLLQRKCPLLPQTASLVGDVQVRNRGTIGGSLAHADPAADMPAAALALDVEIKAVNPKGERLIAARDFFVGAYETVLSPEEILTEIRVPVLSGHQTAYLKSAPRPSDFALVGVAVHLKVGGDGVCQEIGIGVTGVSDPPYRAQQMEAALKGQALGEELVKEAATTVTEGVEVVGGVHASSGFRTHLAKVFAARAVMAALQSNGE